MEACPCLHRRPQSPGTGSALCPPSHQVPPDPRLLLCQLSLSSFSVPRSVISCSWDPGPKHARAVGEPRASRCARPGNSGSAGRFSGRGWPDGPRASGRDRAGLGRSELSPALGCPAWGSGLLGDPPKVLPGGRCAPGSQALWVLLGALRPLAGLGASRPALCSSSESVTQREEPAPGVLEFQAGFGGPLTSLHLHTSPLETPP